MTTLFGLPPVHAEDFARSLTDRPDQVSGNEIHFVYVLTKGETDEHRDTNNVINGWVQEMQTWLQKSLQHQLSIDTFNGRVDVTFLQSAFTADQLCRTTECNALGKLSQELHAQDPQFSAAKVYIFNLGVILDSKTCGWAIPSSNLGLTFSNANQCNYPDSTLETGIRFRSFAIAHEIFHTFGVSSFCGDGSDLMLDFPQCRAFSNSYGHVITTIDTPRKNYVGGDASGLDLLQVPVWSDGSGTFDYVDVKPLSGNRLVLKLEKGQAHLKVGGKTGRLDWIWSKRIDATFRENFCVLSSAGDTIESREFGRGCVFAVPSEWKSGQEYSVSEEFQVGPFHGSAKLVGTLA